MTIRRSVMAVVTTALLITSCAIEAEPIDQTPATGPTTTEPSPNTTVAPTTPVAPRTTSTSTSSVLDEAGGSGCTPGSGRLKDGEWFGYVVTTTNIDVEFDLACWFSGDAATRAAAEDGEESPPPNDYYIRNDNETLRTLAVSDGTEVAWYPQPGDPTSEATIGYPGWTDAIEDRELVLMVWLTVENGQVVGIREQWVP